VVGPLCCGAELVWGLSDCLLWYHLRYHKECPPLIEIPPQFLNKSWLQDFAGLRERYTARVETFRQSIAEVGCSHQTTHNTRHGTAQHSTARHGTARHGTARHGTAPHSTAQHSTAQHSTAQHSTA
jgi:hypothetical protein